MSKILCFGELLLRLTPDDEGNWLNNNYLPAYPAGAEANVAAALALWNVPVKYVTVLPDNVLGKQLKKFLEEKNIDTADVMLGGNRLGIYYLTEGSDLKSTGVIYDRVNSSFSNLKKGVIDWNKIFKDVSWFHFSAISPALNSNLALVCEQALKVASEKKINISVDLNYRPKLWQYGKFPSEIMPSLVKYCNVVFGNIWAAEKMLSIPLNTHVENKLYDNYIDQAKTTSNKILEQFSKCNTVINTFRFNEPHYLRYYATLCNRNEFLVSNIYEGTTNVGSVGTGDCCMAGIIKGTTENWSNKKTIDFAAAAAFRKGFLKTDFISLTEDELLTSINEHEQAGNIK